MPSPHPLDRPVWNALKTRQASLARGDGQALRFAPEYGPFAAAEDNSPASQAALAGLAFGEDGLWLVEPREAAAPPGMTAALHAPCYQMIARQITQADCPFAVIALDEGDAMQMLTLATLTRPGPFASHTHRLGAFVGVKQYGRLVAMAGERMQPDGFTEVSGVCTHPEHRGQGYASALLRIVAERILARGETPFLHAYVTNTGAIELYKSLGFTYRRTVTLTVLKRGA